MMNLQAMRQSSVFASYCHLCRDYELPERACSNMHVRGFEPQLSYTPPRFEPYSRIEGHFRPLVALPSKNSSSPECSRNYSR